MKFLAVFAVLRCYAKYVGR